IRPHRRSNRQPGGATALALIPPLQLPRHPVLGPGQAVRAARLPPALSSCSPSPRQQPSAWPSSGAPTAPRVDAAARRGDERRLFCRSCRSRPVTVGEPGRSHTSTPRHHRGWLEDPAPQHRATRSLPHVLPPHRRSKQRQHTPHGPALRSQRRAHGVPAGPRTVRRGAPRAKTGQAPTPYPHRRYLSLGLASPSARHPTSKVRPNPVAWPCHPAVSPHRSARQAQRVFGAAGAPGESRSAPIRSLNQLSHHVAGRFGAGDPDGATRYFFKTCDMTSRNTGADAAEVFSLTGSMMLTETTYCGSSAGANPDTDTRYPFRYPPLPFGTWAVPVLAAIR